MFSEIKRRYGAAGLIISAAGLFTLLALFGWWYFTAWHSVYGVIAALVSAAIFAVLCLRFVPGWVRSWTPGGDLGSAAVEGDEPVGIRARLFSMGLIYCAAVFLLTWLIRRRCGYSSSWQDFLGFWRLTDSQAYIDIARDWYLSEGVIDRLVQLVFLPGYPLAIRLMYLLVPDYTIAALLVSWFSFSGALGVCYSLLRLDYSHKASLRCVKFLCLMPGAFFFAAPMSESLFLLLSLSCVYQARRGRWAVGCTLGGLAAFTRSLGLMLFVPVCMELVRVSVNAPRAERKLQRFAWLLLIPAGFAVYCLINYQVAGNPFQYMTYQHEHWSQGFGLFFATAAYQLDYAISCVPDDLHTLWGLWLPNLIYDFGALIIVAIAAKRLRPGYTAWFIAYYVIAIGATWLLSAPRYLMCLFPLFLSLSLLADTPRRNLIATLACAPLWLGYEVAFALRWQVW